MKIFPKFNCSAYYKLSLSCAMVLIEEINQENKFNCILHLHMAKIMWVIKMKIGHIHIINADQKNAAPSAFDPHHILLTCGLSFNATVTASSIDDDGFVYCLQRSIFTLSHRVILPQEFHIAWHEKHEDIYPFLETVTLLLVCEIPTETIRALQF